MLKRIFIVLSILSLNWIAFASTATLLKVTILDSEFNIKCTIETPEKIKEFQYIWSNKYPIDTTIQPVFDWDYKIDIQTKNDSTRWLYASKMGTCRVLSKNETPVY